MNKSNKLCRNVVTTICGTFFLFILSMFGFIGKRVEAGNQIPGAFVDEELVQSTINENINLVLVGTVLSDAGKSLAIFENNKTNTQQFHKLGDTIEGGCITKILKDRVILTEDGADVELKIGYGSGNSYSYENTDGKITTNTMKPLTSDADLSELESSVSLIYEGAAEILEVEDGGLLSQLGLQPGDIVRNINLRVLDSDLSFYEAVAQDIGNGKEQLRLELERGGEEKVIYNMFMNDQPAE